MLNYGEGRHWIPFLPVILPRCLSLYSPYHTSLYPIPGYNIRERRLGKGVHGEGMALHQDIPKFPIFPSPLSINSGRAHKNRIGRGFPGIGEGILEYFRYNFPRPFPSPRPQGPIRRYYWRTSRYNHCIINQKSTVGSSIQELTLLGF